MLLRHTKLERLPWEGIFYHITCLLVWLGVWCGALLGDGSLYPKYQRRLNWLGNGKHSSLFAPEKHLKN